MAKKDESNETLDKTVAGKTGLADMSGDQLAHLGGELDDLDNEDFSEADFGNDFDPDATPDKDADSEDDSEDDKEDDSEDDSEDDDSEDDDSEDDDKKAKQTVPLSRFREVNKRMRELEKRLDEKERTDKASEGRDPDDEQAAYDFDKAEEEAMDLLLDGNKEAYKAKRSEIRAAMKAEIDADTRATSAETVDFARDKEVMDELADVYADKYPAMDIDHPDFNPEVNTEVRDLMLGYIEGGETPAKAFKKALDRAVKFYELDGDSEGDEDSEGKGKTGTKKKSKKAASKKKKQTREKINKGKKAPPDTTGAGGSGDSGKTDDDIDVTQLSDEELDALPESKLKALRGDAV